MAEEKEVKLLRDIKEHSLNKTIKEDDLKNNLRRHKIEAQKEAMIIQRPSGIREPSEDTLTRLGHFRKI